MSNSFLFVCGSSHGFVAQWLECPIGNQKTQVRSQQGCSVFSSDPGVSSIFVGEEKKGVWFYEPSHPCWQQSLKFFYHLCCEASSIDIPSKYFQVPNIVLTNFELLASVCFSRKVHVDLLCPLLRSSLFDQLQYCKVTNFRPVPIFVHLTWNWFARTNFRTFDGFMIKSHWNSTASKQKEIFIQCKI